MNENKANNAASLLSKYLPDSKEHLKVHIIAKWLAYYEFGLEDDQNERLRAEKEYLRKCPYCDR